MIWSRLRTGIVIMGMSVDKLNDLDQRLSPCSMIQHLKSRKCNLALYPQTGLTPEEARFPLYNFGGKRTGFVAYRPNGPKRAQNDERGKYYTYITLGEVGIFGLESMEFSRPIFLVGGLFKATALHRLGFTALHVSSVSYKVLKPQLRLLRRPYYAIGDADTEGAQFVERYGGVQSSCDVDEMEDEAILKMIGQFL